MFNSRAYVINFVWRSGYAKSTCMFLFLPLHAFIYGCTMQNDLTTVEPPISVTAVSISGDNCFQSPFFSDLLVGFFPFCQKFWKFRLRNKWNASLPCGNFLVKAQATQLCFEFLGTACGESGPLPQVVLFDRSVWSDRNLLLHVKKLSFPFLLCQASNQTFSQNWMDPFNLFGDFKRFPFNQKVWFAFLAENGTAFSKSFKKRTTLRGITRFSETFSGNFSLHSTLIWEFLEFLVEWFTFRKFNSLWNFWTLFWEISLQLASVSKFSKVLVEWKASFVSINVVPFSPYNFTGFCLFGFI